MVELVDWLPSRLLKTDYCVLFMEIRIHLDWRICTFDYVKELCQGIGDLC